MRNATQRLCPRVPYLFKYTPGPVPVDRYVFRIGIFKYLGWFYVIVVMESRTQRTYSTKRWCVWSEYVALPELDSNRYLKVINRTGSMNRFRCVEMFRRIFHFKRCPAICIYIFMYTSTNEFGYYNRKITFPRNARVDRGTERKESPPKRKVRLLHRTAISLLLL